MEENEIMNEGEVLETTEEIVKTASNGCFKEVAAIGLAMIAGGLVCKFIVEPGVDKIKAWYEERKTKKLVVVSDANFIDDRKDDNEDSEE